MKIEEYKKLTRLYLPVENLHTGVAVLTDDKQAHYLKNVMRKEVGDLLRIFNGKDGEFLGEISELNKNSCSIDINERICAQQQGSDLWAVAALVKKDAQDLMVEKAGELGAAQYFPVLTANSVVHKLNRERLQAIAIEAAEQCERTDVMSVEGEQKLTKLIEANKERKFIICVERLDCEVLHEVTVRLANYPLALVIGPEGGFSADEVSIFKTKENVVFASLGKNILRAETALIAGLAIAQSALGK